MLGHMQWNLYINHLTLEFGYSSVIGIKHKRGTHRLPTHRRYAHIKFS